MIIPLPRQFRAEELYKVMLSNFGDPFVVPNEVVFDFSEMGFVRPSGIVFLSNLTRFLSKNGCKVKYKGMNANRECIRYLDDSGFFAQHLGRGLTADCHVRPTTKPLHVLKPSESHGWIEGEFLPWFSSQAGLPVEELAEFKTCLSEVFNNILDHSDLDVGSIFAQWYPQEERLEIVVADFGQGIPQTVRRIEPHLEDSDAIVRAFDDGFSSQSTPQNRGAGLYYLKQNVLDHLGGKLTVRSQFGAVQFKKSGNSLRTVPYNKQGFCPGTMIEIEVRTSQIELSNAKVEDFQW